jgi:hypothetical protein
MKSILHRAGLGLALAACVSVAALAQPSDQTRIDVRTKYGTVETVVFDSLAAGDVRSLSTAAGNPALITATDTGVKLELAGETFDVALPDPDALDGAELPAGAKIVKVRKEHKAVDAQQQVEKKVVVRHNGDGVEQKIERRIEADVEGDIEAELALAMAEGAEPGPLAEGQRIRVIRQIRHDQEQVTR